MILFCARYRDLPVDSKSIYTKALADRILSSVQRSKNLRVKPGFPVRIFYLFKMSSKKLISRIYIYIRNRWYFELINYENISLNYSICWIRVYIYGFLHFQWYILFDEEWISTKSTTSYQYIHQRRNHHWYHWSVGIFYLLVSCIYIEVFCTLHELLITVSNKEWTFNVSISEFGWSRWTSHFIYETT